MTHNLTSPRARTDRGCPMAAYDRLPPDLRAFLAGAALPWSPRSVLKVWRRALRRTGDRQAALARLKAVEAGTLAQEATAVWGASHPVALRQG
jgi:Family of unknown function (DUF6525)